MKKQILIIFAWVSIIYAANPPVTIDIRNEQPYSNNNSAIRIRILNNSSSDIENLTFCYDFNAYKDFKFEKFYLPDLISQIDTLGLGKYRLNFKTKDGVKIKPQTFFPNSSGIVFGLHYNDWSLWNHDMDYSYTKSSSFIETKKVRLNHECSFNNLSSIDSSSSKDSSEIIDNSLDLVFDSGSNAYQKDSVNTNSDSTSEDSKDNSLTSDPSFLDKIAMGITSNVLVAIDKLYNLALGGGVLLDDKKLIFGFDRDSNGVRDDIDLYIDQTFPNNPKSRAIYRYYAKATFDEWRAYDNNNDITYEEIHPYSVKVSYASNLMFYNNLDDHFNKFIKLFSNSLSRIRFSRKIGEIYHGESVPVLVIGDQRYAPIVNIAENEFNNILIKEQER